MVMSSFKGWCSVDWCLLWLRIGFSALGHISLKPALLTEDATSTEFLWLLLFPYCIGCWVFASRVMLCVVLELICCYYDRHSLPCVMCAEPPPHHHHLSPFPLWPALNYCLPLFSPPYSLKPLLKLVFHLTVMHFPWPRLILYFHSGLPPSSHSLFSFLSVVPLLCRNVSPAPVH